MAYHAAPRIRGFSYRGTHAYLVTVCTFARRPSFAIPDVVDIVTSGFLRSAGRHQVAVSAYCFMPDHLHAVCRGLSREGDLRGFIAGVKAGPSRWFAREYGGELWQQGFHDRVLRTEQAVADAIAYVVRNPVRAGFVATPGAWPFIGSCTSSRDELIAAVVGERR